MDLNIEREKAKSPKATEKRNLSKSVSFDLIEQPSERKRELFGSSYRTFTFGAQALSKETNLEQLENLTGTRFSEKDLYDPISLSEQIEETLRLLNEEQPEATGDDEYEFSTFAPDPKGHSREKGPRRWYNKRVILPPTEKVSEAAKDCLAKDPRILSHIPALGHHEPIIGLTIYIGSPVNGEMVVANPGVVNDWLVYLRKAESKKVIKKQDELLPLSEINKLCPVTLLPEGRHKFNIGYDCHPGLKCRQHGHTSYVWRSASYPCSIVTCYCPQ